MVKTSLFLEASYYLVCIAVGAPVYAPHNQMREREVKSFSQTILSNARIEPYGQSMHCRTRPCARSKPRRARWLATAISA